MEKLKKILKLIKEKKISLVAGSFVKSPTSFANYLKFILTKKLEPVVSYAPVGAILCRIKNTAIYSKITFSITAFLLTSEGQS